MVVIGAESLCGYVRDEINGHRTLQVKLTYHPPWFLKIPISN